MFTPPPSPLPPARGHSAPPCTVVLDELRSRSEEPPSVGVPPPRKRKPLPSLRWSVILVPIALISIAAMTRFVTHPAAFDLLIPGAKVDRDFWTDGILDWSPHERHRHPQLSHPARGVSSSHSRRDVTPTPVPPVPQNPILPAPFPQPFDTTLSTNFSTNECYNFFLNMTQTTAFRSCRPFSLLITRSQAFEEVQNNITAMNIDVWGTCNTAIPWDQCTANIHWFASALESACQIDLNDGNTMAANTLTALQAYDIMRNASCQVDPAIGSYCYVESVANTDPSSYWFYLLPLGQPLINITSSACNPCMQSLMAMYSNALKASNGTSLSGLQETYQDAAQSLNSACGANYAVATTVNAGLTRVRIPRKEALLLGVSIAHLYFSA